jgi:pyruvate kinase
MSKICREAEVDINYAELYPSIRRQIVLPILFRSLLLVGNFIYLRFLNSYPWWLWLWRCVVKTVGTFMRPVIVLTESGATATAISKYRQSLSLP